MTRGCLTGRLSSQVGACQSMLELVSGERLEEYALASKIKFAMRRKRQGLTVVRVPLCASLSCLCSPSVPNVTSSATSTALVPTPKGSWNVVFS